jgi:ubiquinone/menaquinone biosynthesis C-methylase UbiE
MEVSFNNTVCPVCSQSDNRLIREYRYHHPVFAGRSLVSCNQCQMVFVSPMPDEAEWDAYNSGYFENAHGGLSTDKLGMAFHAGINLLRVLHVEAFQKLHSVTVKNVLEIGPGSGQFASKWLSRHKETLSYYGVESDSICHEKLKALGLTVSADLSALPSDQKFELVVISHVLEHTIEPAKFLNSCTRLLSPGGILFIEVPCKDYEHKEMDEPHLLFFDKYPMELLLDKTGFGMSKLSYHGKTINDLKKNKPSYSRIFNKFRHLFLRMGVFFPFAMKEEGLYGVDNPLERAMVKPFNAHKQQTEHAWWLRAIAIKNQ